jgi:hypothetical protein
MTGLARCIKIPLHKKTPHDAGSFENIKENLIRLFSLLQHCFLLYSLPWVLLSS